MADSSHSIEPVKAAVRPLLSNPTPVSAAAQTILGKPPTSKEADLEDLFARLNAETSSTIEVAVKQEPLGDSPESPSMSEDIKKVQDDSDVPASKSNTEVAHTSLAAVSSEEQQPEATVTAFQETEDISRADLEHMYLRKAYEYLQALPAVGKLSVQVLKTTSKKLRISYAPDRGLPADEVEKLQKRYAFAIVNYLNNSQQKSAKSITFDIAKSVLQETNGDMLQLFSKLVDAQYLSLTDIESSAGLCKTILDILPKAEAAAEPFGAEGKLDVTTIVSAPVADAKLGTSQEQVSKDPIDRVKAWPTQEKRENRKFYENIPPTFILTQYSCPAPRMHLEGCFRSEKHQRAPGSCLGR